MDLLELIESTRPALAVIERELSGKRLEVAQVEGEESTQNPLFALFGSQRYERVLHEFVANMLEGSHLQPCGHELLAALMGRCGATLNATDSFFIETEVDRPGVSIDILATIPRRGTQVAIEIKVDHFLPDKQAFAYAAWLTGDPRRKCIIVAPRVAPTEASASFVWVTWWWLSGELRRILEVAKKRNAFVKHNYDFLRDFAEGIGRL